MRNKIILFLFVIIISVPNLIFAQENVFLAAYGKDAPTREGDDDFRQIIYFKIPESATDSVYLRIFDADIGGNWDTKFQEFDTQTRFRLYGGTGAYSNPQPGTPYPPDRVLFDGTLIIDEYFGEDNFKDNKWFNYAVLSPSQGHLVNGFYYFKLIVSGETGNDGNIFDVTLSTQDKSNRIPEGAEIFSFAPTLRLPSRGRFAEMRFFLPDTVSDIAVYNFDLAGGNVAVETPFRSDLVLASSGQDEWASGTIQLDDDESGRYNAIKFAGGQEIPNDATFYVLSSSGDRLTLGNAIPIKLPIYFHKPNSRPVPVVSTKVLSDCYTVVFDASQSTDADGDAMEFIWDFGDGNTKRGTRIAHTYDDIRFYTAELLVIDASGQVGNSSLKTFEVALNNPPVARAGADVTVAPNELINFDASASSDNDGQILTYIWDFDDGNRTEGVTAAHTYIKPGIYNVELRVEDNSDSPCKTDTDNLQVFVNATPVVEIGGDKIAAVNETLTFDGGQSYDSDGEIVSYQWDMGDGTTKSGQIVDHQYASPGEYNVRLLITDNTNVSNNSASDELTVTVNDKPQAVAGSDKVVAKDEVVTFDASQSVDADGQITNYFWDFGDGTTGAGMVVTHSFTEPGKYDVKLSVTDNSGSISNKAEDQILVVVNYPPVAEAGENVVVTESAVRFDGTNSSDSDGEITEYLWNFGDGTTSTEPAPVHVYSLPGTYNVTLTVTDNSNTSTESTSDNLTVTINEAPIADAGRDVITSPGEELTFSGSNSVDPDGSISKYEWDFGDGNTAEGEAVKHAFDKPGVYSVKLTVTDNLGHTNAVDFDELIVTVNHPPVAAAGQDVLAAPGEVINLDGSSSYDFDGSLVSYNWSFNDGSPDANSAVITKSFGKPGIYTAQLTVTDSSSAGNASTSDQITIKINHSPESRPGENIFTCSSTVEFDGSLSADADGDALKYTWDFGDGSPVKEGISVIHTYTKSGTYPVILTVDDGTGLSNSVNTSSITIFINQPPIADAGEDKTVCAGEVVLFDGSGTIDPEGGLLKYYWDFGDGTSAEGLNPTKTYDLGGVYEVTLTVKDDSNLPCSTDVDQIVVNVAESPVANAGEDQTVCANTVVQFDGNKSIDYDGVVNNFSWDFGDGSTGGGAAPTHVYTTPGTYRVLLTITGDLVGECDNTDKDEMIVTVLDAPIPAFTYPEIAAVNSPVSFDGSKSDGKGATITNWVWDFGDGNTSEGQNVFHTYDEPGKYFVELTIETDSKAGCSSTPIKDFIIVNAAPEADAGEDKYAGVNEVVTFNAENSEDSDGSIVSYEWDLGDGTVLQDVEVRHRYTEPGNYRAILRVRDNTTLSNNNDIDTINVKINDSPVPVIDAPEWGCAGSPVTLSASASYDSDGDIDSYKWNFGDGTASDTSSVDHVFTSPGKYNITLTINDGDGLKNSVNTASKIVKINRKPIAAAGNDLVVCPGDAVMLDAGNSFDRDGFISTYDWDLGDGSTGTGSQFTHIYTESGVYEVTLTVADNSGLDCGINTDKLTVIVNGTPVADAGGDKSAYFGGAHDAVFFDGTNSSDPDGDPLTYSWDFGDGTSGNGAVVSHKYTQAGTYNVTLTVSDGKGKACSTAFDTITVTINNR